MYKDKNGRQIKKGDIVHCLYDDSYEYVFSGCDEYSRDSLGLNANNIDYLELHPEQELQIYPFEDFDMNDFEVVEGTVEDNISKFTDRYIRLLKARGVL